LTESSKPCSNVRRRELCRALFYIWKERDEKHGVTGLQDQS
jgi:hypothetical protein